MSEIEQLQGRMIGDYSLLRRISQGGMADIYLAHKMSPYGHVRRAVIKTVNRSRPDFRALQAMLLDEARALSNLEHPNLVQILDVGEFDQGLYLALEYVVGTDLRHVANTLEQRQEALPFELACFIVIELLRGLHHAHLVKAQDGYPLNLVHRDVNPSNILLASYGHVKLGDFGVAAMRGRIQQSTDPGLVKGKYPYLAPEYIAGEASGPLADIYAAGVVLFELLSGRPCFVGRTPYEIMWRVVNQGVPANRLEREGVPADLVQIVLRGTNLVPERRFATAEEFADALETWMVNNHRHASPWVMAVFLRRHDLLPKPIFTRLEDQLSPMQLATRQTMPEIPLPNLPTADLPQATAESDSIAFEDPEWLSGSTAESREATPVPRATQQQRALTPSPESRGFGPTPAPETRLYSHTPSRVTESEVAETVAPTSKPTQEDRRRTPAAIRTHERRSADGSIEGKLEDAPATEILLELHAAKQSGIVEFRCGMIWKQVRVEQGQPVSVTSNMGMELIGEHLVKARLLTRATLDQALEQAERKQVQLTTVLLEQGVVGKPVLEEELGKNLARRLEEVFEWRWGDYRFTPQAIDPSPLRPRLDVEALVEKVRAEWAAPPASPKSATISGGTPTQKQLRDAFEMARTIAESTGKGRVDQLGAAQPKGRHTKNDTGGRRSKKTR